MIAPMLTASPLCLGPTSVPKNHNATVLVPRDTCHSIMVIIALTLVSLLRQENTALLTGSAEWEVNS